MGNYPHDNLACLGAGMMIEDAREFLKTLAADGLDAYLDRVWEMREPVDPKPSSNKGWPMRTAQQDFEGRLGLAPRKNLVVLK
jgi:hypothetical protein